MIPIVRLFNPKGADRVAVVSVQATWASADGFTIQVVRGPRRSKLHAGRTYGPFPADGVAARHAEVLASLRAEGFVRGGLTALLQSLTHGDAKVRAHAAQRLGWLGDSAAVEALLAAAERATTDLPSIIDALGMIGDPRALPLCRTEAARKLLSRRRSGVESLRALNDATGLDDARAVALARLPDVVRNHLEVDDVAAMVQAVSAVDERDRGLVVDTLYELATPTALAATRVILTTQPFGRPHLWRYAKSVFKRAMLRHDAETFGVLAHAIEVEARATKPQGAVAQVKSGLDGVQRPTKIFRRTTQDYVRRLAWRYLRRLASHRPDLYAPAAAEALAAYTPKDVGTPKGLYGEWARCYLLHRVLWGASQRFTFAARSMRFRFVSSKAAAAHASTARDEAFAELWDASPRAYLRLLVRARLPEVVSFATRAITERHPTVMHGATLAELLSMLDAPVESTIALAVNELERRFDPNTPDWTLVTALVTDARTSLRELGQRWLTATAHLWTTDVDRIMAFLKAPDAGVRTLAAGLVVASLDEADTWMRRELAERILTVLQGPEPTPGAHEGYARVARDGLGAELSSMLTLAEVMALVGSGSPSAQSMAGAVLARKPEALTELGIQRITAMAMHDVAAVRAAGQGLLRQSLVALGVDPSPLFSLAESRWPDARTFAFETLRSSIDLAALGIDGLVGLCDSNDRAVQDLGRELVLRHFDKLDPQEIIGRLAQHPHANIRRFALDLVVGHLKDGFIPLARLEGFFRTALLDLWPSRREKRLVVDFLTQRGLKDPRQAEVSSRVLDEFVRTKAKGDFEDALSALVRIKMAFPETESSVAVASGVTVGAGA